MTIAPDIINAAQAAQRKWSIPAAISLAQFGLESGWGAHMPPGSNNPFGIKALAGQPSVTVPTHEFVGGRYVVVEAAFAAYPSLDAAFDAHAELLATSHYYAVARAQLPNANAFAQALTGVYATDPNYGAKLIALMQADNLYQYDQLPVVALAPTVVSVPTSSTAVLPSSNPPTAGATAQPIAVAPSVPRQMTDFTPPDPIQLPSQAVAQIAGFGTHWGAALGGFIGSLGWLAPGDEAKFASIGGGIAVLVVSMIVNAIAQELRHQQALKVVAVAKAS